MKNRENVFRALADEARLRIINLLIKSDRVLCVCEIMDALKIPQYAVSKALTLIKNADLVITDKEGTWVYYQLNKEIPENKILFNFLRNYLNSDTFIKDEKNLYDRLLLRENNKCVVGIIPEKDLFKMIKEKSKA